MYSTLAALAIVGALLWLWRDSLRARELAAQVARRACEAQGLQFLDDTVALAALRPVLDHGRPALRRIYQFEFSREGDDRREGSVSVTGARLETVYFAEEGTAPPERATVVRLDRVRRDH